MTNTTTYKMPSNAEIRIAWVETLEATLDDMELRFGGDPEDVPSGWWLYLLERIRTEGPQLARSDNERWARRFRFIDLQIKRKVAIDAIVEFAVRELRLKAH